MLISKLVYSSGWLCGVNIYFHQVTLFPFRVMFYLYAFEYADTVLDWLFSA